jgi:Holliday junction DNA helicase RuvA
LIARLKGVLHLVDLDRVLVDVGGVGYEVHLSRTSFAALPSEGEGVTLEIHTHVREDALLLYGFATREEKSLFLKLVQVSGIGPKVALSILSGLAPRELASAIAREDVKRLTQIPHVGKKTAERIVVELKDKIGNVVELPVSIVAPPPAPRAPAGPREEAVSALMNLGYRRPEAEEALSQVPLDVRETGELVRRALKGLAGRLAR